MTTYEENKDMGSTLDFSLDDILGEFKFVGIDSEIEDIISEVRDGTAPAAEDDDSGLFDFSVEAEMASDGDEPDLPDIEDSFDEEPEEPVAEAEEEEDFFEPEDDDGFSVNIDDIIAGIVAERAAEEAKYLEEEAPEEKYEEPAAELEEEYEEPEEKPEENDGLAEEIVEEVSAPAREELFAFDIDDIIAGIVAERAARDEKKSEAPEEPIKAPEPETPEENVFTEHENAASGDNDYVIDRTDFDEEYADGGSDYEAAQDADEVKPVKLTRRRKESRSFREKIIDPAIRLLALAALKIQQSRSAIGSAPAKEEEDLGRELPPAKAAKFYGARLANLKLRMRLSFLLSIVTVYISLGLPVVGSLNYTATSAAVCLIMLLTVMMLGLDIITAGILALCSRKPDINSLVALSCILSVIDGFIVATGATGNGLPFCAVSALTVSFSLMGSLLNARSARLSLRAAASAGKPYTVTAEASVTGDGITLIKSKTAYEGFVRRVEESGPDEIVFGTLSPYILAASLILSIIAALIAKNFAGFIHILSGTVCAAVPVSILFVYPLPFFVSSKIMIHSGSSIAGWSGLYDIGKSKHMIITDRDLFPKNDVKIDAIRFVDGTDPEKAISYAGSMIIASGSALAPAFSDLIEKGNGVLLKVDEFSCHESGGLVALINGDEVFCGSSGFMQLMGVRLPNKYAVRDRVFIAASGALCGFFDIKYTAQHSVKEALASLFRTDRHPIFAVRDFNVTPQMISRKFDIPTDGFDFPAFTERYEISSARPADISKPAAIVSHEGLGAFVELADRGRILYNVVRVSVMMSVICAALGMIFMFIKMAAGTAAVSWLLVYMIIWLIPEIGICFFLIEK